ncbi:MAG: PAS domain-containing protein [Bacteroidia bacterium]|nr:PAS domain-containing protein [Bacteroidia bacterium]
MNPQNVDIEKLTEIFPHLEAVLNFGTYTRNVITKEVFWSSGIYRILELDENDIEPSIKNFTNLIVQEDVDIFTSVAKKHLATKQNYGLEFSVISGKGNYKRIYAETFFKVDENNNLLEYAGVLKDITESYNYKKALEEKVIQLDKSNQSLQEFAYVASHDLQEPVRKINTFAERLVSKFGNQLNDEGLTYLRRMQNSSHNMQILLDDLLNFSRLSFYDKAPEKVALKECLESVLNDLEVKIEETKTTITCTELPVIEGYATQLKQLFNNLIGNAIKFRSLTKNPVIQISYNRVNPFSFPQYPLLKNTHYAKIEISDNGIGFEQEYAEKIFMIFQRLNSRVEYSGSGIGLSICKKIIENHHGQIFANSALNQGSTFILLLPYTIN